MKSYKKIIKKLPKSKINQTPFPKLTIGDTVNIKLFDVKRKAIVKGIEYTGNGVEQMTFESLK